MKIVINRRHGGFGLSDWGIIEYARRAGITLFVHEPTDALSAAMAAFSGTKDYWLVPQDQRPKPLEPWVEQPIEVRKAYNENWSRINFDDKKLARNDPHLVAVVEDDAIRASSRFAQLAVIEIPDDVEWEIEDYDGVEWVSEKHRRWD